MIKHWRIFCVGLLWLAQCNPKPNVIIDKEIVDFAESVRLETSFGTLSSEEQLEILRVIGDEIEESVISNAIFLYSGNDQFTFFEVEGGKHYLWIRAGNGSVILGPAERSALMNFVSDARARSISPQLVREIVTVKSAKPEKPLRRFDGSRKLIGSVAVFEFTVKNRNFTARILNGDDRSESWRQSFAIE